MKILVSLVLLTSAISSKLIIQSPKRLAELFPPVPDPKGFKPDLPGVIRASYANFGFIPYGHNMVSNPKME